MEIFGRPKTGILESDLLSFAVVRLLSFTNEL